MAPGLTTLCAQTPLCQPLPRSLSRGPTMRVRHKRHWWICPPTRVLPGSRSRASQLLQFATRTKPGSAGTHNTLPCAIVYRDNCPSALPATPRARLRCIMGCNARSCAAQWDATTGRGQHGATQRGGACCRACRGERDSGDGAHHAVHRPRGGGQAQKQPRCRTRSHLDESSEGSKACQSSRLVFFFV